ncbi:hypothetical protein H0N95_01640, partial [Candidatus Micrarchaeota archaeon]|nr:hypothetical protein [Candidatus Micrarchaeota archaeon]
NNLTWLKEAASEISSMWEHHRSFDIEKMQNLSEALNDLQQGVSTPLLIKSQPKGPTFPLRISSYALGMSEIEVYVIGDTYYEDSNKMMNFDKAKKLTEELKNEVKTSLNVSRSGERVTRLIYNDYLNKLSLDAVLVENQEVKPNFFDDFFGGLAQFFSDLFRGVI